MSSKNLQAPIGGINSYHSLDDMPPEDAVILDNWIPGAGSCRVRGGSTLLDNFGTEPIGTIIPFGDQLIVATDGKIVDTGYTQTDFSGTASDIATGKTSDRWDWQVVSDKLLLVNEADTPQQYDGTTISDITLTGISTPEDIKGVGLFKGRAIYWKDEPSFWYAEAGSYQGTMSEFDLSPWVSRLSKLDIFFTWSVDAGDGADDYAVFLMDTGEALVYQGTDPSNINAWALVGKFRMGQPLSLRSAAPIAGDRLILTRAGWQNFAVVWKTGDFREEGIGKKMIGLAREAEEAFGALENWEAHFFAEYGLVIVNVPTSTTTSIQHVLNTDTFAWSTFSGWDAESFGGYAGAVFYGDSEGNLYQAMTGLADEGMPIVTDALPAFNYLNGRSHNKQMTALRPMTTIDRPDTIGLAATSDYVKPSKPTAAYVPLVASGSPWGSAWGSSWSSPTAGEATGEWQSANAHGYSLSYRMQTITNAEELKWYSTTVMFKNAGVI